MVAEKKYSADDYAGMFEEGREYTCCILPTKKTQSCQIMADEIRVQILGIAKNFVFPRRPVFQKILGARGTCKVMLNPEGEGLMAYDIRLNREDVIGSLHPADEGVSSRESGNFTSEEMNE